MANDRQEPGKENATCLVTLQPNLRALVQRSGLSGGEGLSGAAGSHFQRGRLVNLYQSPVALDCHFRRRFGDFVSSCSAADSQETCDAIAGLSIPPNVHVCYTGVSCLTI